jgi:hypothetical protein
MPTPKRAHTRIRPTATKSMSRRIVEGFLGRTG